MKLYSFLLILFLLTVVKGIAQETLNILCVDFKKNDQIFSQGKQFRLSFESVLSNLEHPPIVIEREKLSQLLSQIQDEANLQKDFNTNYNEELKAANVDFIIYGGFYKKSLSDSVEFRSECVKISGENIFSKLAFPKIKFAEKDLDDFTIFENEVRRMLSKYSFIKGFGIVDSEQLKEINRRLDEKDKQIKALEEKNSLLESGESYKINFDGSYVYRKGASTSVTGGTTENNLFYEIQKLIGQKDLLSIIKICDKYINENPDSEWLTPKFLKGLALLDTNRKNEGLLLLDEIANKFPGEDYIIPIAKVYKGMGEEKRYESLLQKAPYLLKKKIEAAVNSGN